MGRELLLLHSNRKNLISCPARNEAISAGLQHSPCWWEVAFCSSDWLSMERRFFYKISIVVSHLTNIPVYVHTYHFRVFVPHDLVVVWPSSNNLWFPASDRVRIRHEKVDWEALEIAEWKTGNRSLSGRVCFSKNMLKQKLFQAPKYYISQGLVNVPFWGYWTSPYSSHYRPYT